MATLEHLEKRVEQLERTMRELTLTAAGANPVAGGFRRVENDIAELRQRVDALEKKS